MTKRIRDQQMIFRVTEEERDLIRQRMYLSHTMNQSAFLRKMALDGCIINVDTSYLRKQYEEMHKIGVNINQIAKMANINGSVYQQDIKEVKKMVNEIWRILKSSQSKLP